MLILQRGVKLLTLNPQNIELDTKNNWVLVFLRVSTFPRPSLKVHNIDFKTEILDFSFSSWCVEY